MTNAEESESDRTLWCGNVSEKITDELLYELFLQAGPLMSVKVPSDKEGRRRNFGFILFKHACSVPYAVKLLNGIRLHGRCLNLQYRPGSVHMTPPRTDSQNNDGRMPSPVGPGGVPMPMMDERGLPLLNGMPGMPGMGPGMGNFPSRMGPPLPMQPLMSPCGLHRSYSAPGMSPNDNSSRGGPRDGRDNRDRSRDGRDHSRDRNDRNDRGRDRFDRDDRGHRDNRNRDNSDYRGRDRGHRNQDRSQDRGQDRGQDRDYRNQSQDRNRNSSQDRKNDSGDMSMSRLRKGETFHNFSTPPSLMGSGPPSLMGSAPPGDADLRRGSDSSRDSRDSRSQRNVPPWQQPY